MAGLPLASLLLLHFLLQYLPFNFFVKMKYYYAFIIISFILNIHHDILSFDILNGKIVDKYFMKFLYIYIHSLLLMKESLHSNFEFLFCSL